MQGTGATAGSGSEINVLGNGTTIIDGDTTPSGSDHTDFGSTDVTNGTVTRTFTIQNLGTASLTVGTVSSSNAAEFSIIVQPASIVAAGGNTSFQVRFDPSALGTRSATLSFSNNDSNADENPYNFALQGTGATAGSGSISREVWTGISGITVASIPVGTTPNLTDTLPNFEAPQSWADNYGTRLRGYITAPVTGNYIFWIASDNQSELWLSINNPSDNPVNKVKIASVSGDTPSRMWNLYSSQKSTAIPLTAGQRYYVEALQKEEGARDNLAVGWAKPGQATSAPSEVIPGSVLSPFSGIHKGGPERECPNPHSGQLIRSNTLTRKGLILMVPFPVADPVSILQCPLVVVWVKFRKKDVRVSAGEKVQLVHKRRQGELAAAGARKGKAPALALSPYEKSQVFGSI